MKEEQRDLPGYEGLYRVSDHGRVYSLDRVVFNGRGSYIQKGRELARVTRPNGYLYVCLSKDGTRNTYPVHGLVCLTFLGPRPENMVVRHLDGNPLNNNLDNLVYGTPSENTIDSVRHGTHRQTQKTHCPGKHELIGANLVPSLLKRGQRACLACRKARNYLRWHDGDFQEVSDAYYISIMEGTEGCEGRAKN